LIDIKLQDISWDGAEDGVEALLDKWLVAEKTLVKKGQVLVAVVLVKATIDIEAPEDGFIEKIIVKDGESFKNGAVLAHFTASASNSVNGQDAFSV
jgi:pyruvate/2-oxoglutarate dehydrogenase complex dihydrolipoamide acyltransferase (E2) component